MQGALVDMQGSYITDKKLWFVRPLYFHFCIILHNCYVYFEKFQNPTAPYKITSENRICHSNTKLFGTRSEVGVPRIQFFENGWILLFVAIIVLSYKNKITAYHEIHILFRFLFRSEILLQLPFLLFEVPDLLLY